jgi:pyruvate,orthophosphate dikinase
MATPQRVHLFTADTLPTSKLDASTLGSKGANLVEMTRLALPVPPGFILTTHACKAYYHEAHTLSEELRTEVLEALNALQKHTGRVLGDPVNPLLLSVRSGAPVTMPGMMDTVLNLGLNDATVRALADQAGNERFAWDCYRRFIQMYADVVIGMRADVLEQFHERIKQRENVFEDSNLEAEHLKELVELYKNTILQRAGIAFPDDPMEQLWGAIGGVFASWNNKRANEYRQLYSISADLGTAVTVQTMVFGNLGATSGTGVALTRDPSTGERRLYGEYLLNAQGEDVVAGMQIPHAISEADRVEGDPPSLETALPIVHGQLKDIVQQLESHFGDLQDIEFTIENEKLWMLQTRKGKRTAQAALRIAVEMVEESRITREEALLRIDPQQLDQLLLPRFSPESLDEARRAGRVIARGLPASPGAQVGPVVFDPATAMEYAARGNPAVMVRVETSPDDIQGMRKSAAVVTMRGGMTSHAAVVARGMGRCCVVGCRDFDVRLDEEEIHIPGHVIRKGDLLSIDGTTGEVILGRVDRMDPDLGPHFSTLMEWVDDVAKLDIRANAHTAREARLALNFGAQGIGLCRTEHMFFDPERATAVREMILASGEEERRHALKDIVRMQTGDFKAIFEVMGGLPVTMRLLDPPLHVFLPHNAAELEAVALRANVDVNTLQDRADRLREVNPMLGHRGCRLGISYPEIYEAQVQAIVNAACEVHREKGLDITPEILLPLVSAPRELELLCLIINTTAQQTMDAQGVQLDIRIGTMIELPSAVLEAGKLAKHVDFFTFGTNDLTQTVLGISRDDASRFLPLYVDMGILDDDPFVSLDPAVRHFVASGVERGRATRPDLTVGLCGVHADNPETVRFCAEAGFDFVSCSPWLVPVCRLAAAHAALEGEDE